MEQNLRSITIKSNFDFSLNQENAKDLMGILAADSIIISKQIIVILLLSICFHSVTLKSDKTDKTNILEKFYQFSQSLRPLGLGTVKSILGNRTILFFLILNLFGILPFSYNYLSYPQNMYFVVMSMLIFFYVWMI